MMLIFLITIVFLSGMATFVAWLFSLIFGAAMSLAWILKVWAVICVIAFLWCIFTSYKGNGAWF